MTYKLLKKLDEILGNDPVLIARAAISPLFLVVTWQEKNHPLNIFSVTKGRDSSIALNDKEYIAIATDRFKQYFNNEISISDLQEEYKSWEREVDDFYEEITDKKIKEFSDEELKQAFVKINDLFLGLARKTIYIENVDYEKILGIVGQENKGVLDNIWERAVESAFLSFDGRRLKKLIDIISLDSKNIIRKSKFIYTDYFWPKSEEEISKQLEEIKKDFDSKQEEVEKLEKAAKQKSDEHKTWLDQLNSNARKIAEYAQLVMHMRDLRKDPIAKMQAMMAELSVVILERAGVNVKAAPYILLYEYVKGLDHLKEIKEDVEGRENGCIYVANPDLSYETEPCDFELALKELAEISEKRTEKSETLKGQIACKGKVTGIVRVIYDPHDDKGFQQGDILVTSMTRPEFVPIMKKSGAVVTNEGGITCHAAIVSRELNIPCIIGTKIATQFLKDGMEVEVDANVGIVKIL